MATPKRRPRQRLTAIEKAVVRKAVRGARARHVVAKAHMVITIPCKVGRKHGAMVIARPGRGAALSLAFLEGTIASQREVHQAIRESVTIQEGEALHTALHALGVLAWGRE